MATTDEPASTAEDKNEENALAVTGQDEMNLAELPFASLRNRGDSRKSIVYEGWFTDKQGNRTHQKWAVKGDSEAGLPNEFDERVYVALMKITRDCGLARRKVPFSIYQLIKIMGLAKSESTYRDVEASLDRLVGVTFKSEGAFWDNEKGENITTTTAFHFIEKYWLRYKEKDDRVREQEAVPAYIVWSEDIWKSFKAKYIKSLNLSFFYSLESPIARRLYRLLDKRMWDKSGYEFDIFDLAGKLGMVRYPKPAKIRQKLQPAFDELIARGYLRSAEVVKVKGYTRIRFVRAAKDQRSLPAPQETTAEAGPPPEEDLDPADSGSQEDPTRQLVQVGLAPDKARELTTAYPPAYLEEKLELLAWNREAKKRGRPITNPAAWLLRAIQQDWKPPSSADFTTRAERELEAKEQQRQQAEQEARTRAAMKKAEAEQEAYRRQQQQRQAKRLAALRKKYGTTEAELKLWPQVLGVIQTATTSAVYKTWFQQTELLSLQNRSALIGVANQPAREWLESRLQSVIKRAFEDVGTPVDHLAFEVLSPAGAETSD